MSEERGPALGVFFGVFLGLGVFGTLGVLGVLGALGVSRALAFGVYLLDTPFFGVSFLGVRLIKDPKVFLAPGECSGRLPEIWR